MTHERQSIPSEVFEELVKSMHHQFGEAWLQNKKRNQDFQNAMLSVVEHADGIHMIGSPEQEDDRIEFRVWVDYPVDDLWSADDLAYEVIGQVADDLLLTCRVVENNEVRYRFATGSMTSGHIGTLTFVGPHAREFANLYRIRMTQGAPYHA